MVEPAVLRCSSCGRTRPSIHYFRAPGLCLECFDALGEVERERVTAEHPVPLGQVASEPQGAPWTKLTLKSALTYVVGAALGHYTRLNALIPAVTVSLSTWALTQVLHGRRSQVAKVAGALLGYLLWVQVGLFAGRYLEVAIETVLVGAVLALLLIRPSRESLVVAGAWWVLAVTLNFYQLASTAFGTAIHRALAVHIVLNLYSLFLIHQAWRLISKPEGPRSDSASVIS